MQLQQTIQNLTKHKKFFANLEHITRTKLLLFAQEKNLQQGQTIYDANSSAEYLYFVADGFIELEFKNHSITLETGMHFGEECLLQMSTYFAKAVAKTNVTLLMIPKYAVEQVIDHKNIIVDEFASVFLDRTNNLKIRANNNLITDLSPPPLLKNYILGWMITIITSFAAFMYTDSLDYSNRIFIAIAISTISIMAFKLLDDFVSSIFAMLLCLGFGITDVEVLLANFGSTSFLTALSFFGIGSVIMSSGLVLRFLIFLLKHLPLKYFCINSGLFILGSGLTPLVPDLGIRSQMISDTFYDTFKILNIKRKSPNNTSLAFLFFSSISILGPVFLSSCMDNFIILSIFWGQYQQQFQWFGWFKAALAPGLFMIVGYALVHMIMFYKSDPIETTKNIIQSRSQALGSINIQEWTALLSILVCFLGMVTTSYHHIPPEIVSFLVLISLLAFNFITPIEFRSKIPWNDLIFFTGLSGVITTAEDIGLTNHIASQLSWIAYHMEYNFPLFVIALLGVMTVISFIFPIEFVTLSFVIILVPIAQLNNINPWIIAFVILTLGEVWFHPRQKTDYRDFKSYVVEDCAYNEPKLLRANALLSLIKIASIFVSIPYWRSLGLVS